jgi:hypothetical protein
MKMAVMRMRILSWLLLSLAVWGTSHLRAQTTPDPHAYLYIDPYGARFECLVAVPDLMRQAGKNVPSALAPGIREEVLKTGREAAQTWLEWKLDGQPAPKLALSSVNLVKGVPGRTERPAEDELLVASQTMVGFTWEIELESIPKSMTIIWKGFNAAWTTLPVTVVVGSQSENFMLTAEQPSRVWNNQGRLSLRTPLAEVPHLPPAPRLEIPVASLLFLGVGIVVLVILRRSGGGRIAGRMVLNWIIVLAGTFVLWPVLNVSIRLPGHQQVSSEQAEKILQALLRNTYRAFDQHSESAIYDVLERSIDGDLLQKIYLQTIEALTLDEQDKARVRVTDMDVQVTHTEPRKGADGFVADVRWTVLGTVGHWGHEHQRVNRYLAKVTVAPVKAKSAGKDNAPDAWKMVGLEVLEEKRL